jgi:hypothetical protein
MSEAERKLWLAVLEQAYWDAEMLSIGEEAACQPFERARARQYLRAASPFEARDLVLVCEFANVPADRVVSWARKRYPEDPVIEERSERGKLAPALPAADSTPTTASVPGSKKQEQGPCTPQIAA